MMARPPLLLATFLSLVILPYPPSSAAPSSIVGVNYGQLGSDLPSPATSLRLLRALRAGSVKLYDANPSILHVLSGTNLKLAIMVPNQLIPSLAANRSAADAWVATNLLPFLPAARVRYLLVGNEVLSDFSVRSTIWPGLVPAMYNIKAALDSGAGAGKSSSVVRDVLRRIKVGTTVAMDALLNGTYSRPPSSAKFRPEYAETVVRPLLKFLSKTNSFYFLDAYTYFSWIGARDTIPLDYALLDQDGAQSKPYVDPGTGLKYTNLLQELMDAVAYAMDRIGYPDVRLALAETGWPNGGDYDQAGANPRNAAIYNRNLARWARAGLPTPLRHAAAGKKVPVWVFSLFNENRKPGPGTERHWGLYYPNETAVFGVDLSGRTPDSKLPPLPAATAQGPYEGKIWCVVRRDIASAKPGTNGTEIGNAVAYACGQGNGTCAALQQARSPCGSGKVVQRASYAFNSYWQKFRLIGATCYFNGLAEQVLQDPSFGSCKFPSLSN